MAIPAKRTPGTWFDRANIVGKHASQFLKQRNELDVWQVKEALPHAPKAVASGVRSALVKLEGNWYRLKGCGNNDDGFVVRHNKGGPGEGTGALALGPRILLWSPA